MEPSSPIFDAEPEFLDLDALDPDIYEGFDLYSSSPSEGDDGSVEDQVEVCGCIDSGTILVSFEPGHSSTHFWEWQRASLRG